MSVALYRPVKDAALYGFPLERAAVCVVEDGRACPGEPVPLSAPLWVRRQAWAGGLVDVLFYDVHDEGRAVLRRVPRCALRDPRTYGPYREGGAP